MQKARWDRPQLVVLLRGRPEEAVLSGCKGVGLRGSGSNTARSGCRSGTKCTSGGDCSLIRGS